MGCETYEIGVRDVASGRMMQRTWSAAEVGQGVPWLKHENAQGNDIYIRPAGSVGLVLLDDLNGPAIARLTGDGLAPAVVVQTSPRNFQAWIRVSGQPISQNQATAAARILAERYGGDPNSADWRHFGRLAGFTNRKRVHQRNGVHPYVLVHEATGAVAAQAAQLLMAAQEALIAATPQPPAESPGRGESGATTRTSRSPREAYLYHAERIRARYSTIDYSRLDWSVCKAIACSTPEADQAYLEEAMREGSPGLEERKAGHVEDYVRRTVRKVLQDGEVIEARGRLARKPPTLESPGLRVV